MSIQRPDNQRIHNQVHEFLGKYLFCEFTLCQILPKHHFIIDLLYKKPMFVVLQYHKLLVKVFKLISKHTTHVLGPFSDKMVRLCIKWVDEELSWEGLAKNVHQNVHYRGFCKLLWTVVKSCANFYQ
jgi:hypothetical protein